MHFDLWVPTANPFTTPDLLATIGREAESRGINRIWVGEHVVLFEAYASRYPYAADGRIPVPPGTGLLEPLECLTFLAAHTATVRLGTAMLLLPQRNPVYTAKETSTLDWLSRGRLDLGVGVGWLEEEFEALEVPWARRGARTDEYLQVLTTLWRDDVSSFEGDFYHLPPCSMFPKPLQDPHPPIHIGGESDAALRRAARYGQGWHTFNRPPEGVTRPLATLARQLEDAGRSRADIEVTVCPYFHEATPERVEQYAEQGVDALAVTFFVASPADVPSTLDALQPSQDRARNTS